MDIQSLTIAAVNGAAGFDDIIPVLERPYLSLVVAASNNVDVDVRAVAALAAERPALLDHDAIVNPKVHAAIRRLIGADVGQKALSTWASLVPPGWGADIAEKLMDAVDRNVCHPGIAAALIGPNDSSASLLHTPDHAAVAIQAWGKFHPDAPTWWVKHMSESVRANLLTCVRNDARACASTLPWLPPESIVGFEIPDNAISNALESFAQASAHARSLHRDVMHQLIERATQANMQPLTKLAMASRETAATIWKRIEKLLPHALDRAYDVAVASSWDAIPQSIRTIMHAGAEQSIFCAAIAFARTPITLTRPIPIRELTAAAFFAVLDPRRWSDLEEYERDAWIGALSDSYAHFAVRSLGFAPNIVAPVLFVSNDLIAAIRSRTRDDAACREIIFPLALRGLFIKEAHPIIAGMRHMPDDPVAFAVLASAQKTPVPINHACRPTSLRDLADMTAALRLIQRPLPDRCEALSTVAHGRSWDDIRRIASLLDERERTYLFPEPEAILDKFSVQLERRRDWDMLSRALQDMMSPPPEIGVPALHALAQLARVSDGSRQAEAAITLMEHLRNHGPILDLVVAALRGGVKKSILPLPSHQHLAKKLRELLRIDPLVAHRLAHALKEQHMDEALACLRDAPPDVAADITTADPKLAQFFIASNAPTMLLRSIANKEHAESLITAWHFIVKHRLTCAFGVIALSSDDPEKRRRAVAFIAEHHDIMRHILPMLRDDIQKEMQAHPLASLVIADMTGHDRPPSFFGKRRRTT